MKSLVLAIAAAALWGAMEHNGPTNPSAFIQALGSAANSHVTPDR